MADFDTVGVMTHTPTVDGTDKSGLKRLLRRVRLVHRKSHEIFGLPQSGRDEAPRDRLVLFYRDGTEIRFHIRENAFLFGRPQYGSRLCARAAVFLLRRAGDSGRRQVAERR